MSKDEVVAALEEIGTLMELKGETGFRARAYLGAARALAEQSDEPAALVKAKRLGTVRGVGSSLAGVIETLVNTGPGSAAAASRFTFPTVSFRRR